MSFTSANIPSPTLAWQFEGNTTDIVTGLTGTTTGSISYVSGKYNQAVNINNPNNLTTANYISYSLTSSSFSPTSFTWAYWVNYGLIPVPGTNVQSAVYFTDSLASYTQFRVTLNGARNSGSRPYMYNNSTYLDCPIINQSIWNHYCVVLTSGSGGSTITLYFNGSLVGSFVGNNNQAATINNMYVGSANTIYGAVCAVDDLRLFNTSLTATQVQTIYSQNGNSSIGTISRFFGGAGPSQMSNVTPGSVLAYSYLYSTVNIQGVCAGVDAGSNVYFGFQTSVLSATMFPNSFQKVPDPYYSFFPSGGANGALLLKYNKLGKLIGMMKTSPSNQIVSGITTDSGSNTYVTVSGVIGSSWNAYDIDGSNPNLNAQSVPAVTNILKYSPAGKLLGWGGGLLGTAGITMQVALDSGSNVYMCGYYRNSATGTIYNIGTTNTVGGTLPSSVTPATAGAGGFWPAIFKWSPAGTFLGYSVIRCQNNAAACVALNAVGQSLAPDKLGNIYWGGAIGSNIYCNVNSISTTEPTTNSYSLNTTQVSTTITNAGSNAFVIQFGPSGIVNKFTEIGYGPASASNRFMAATGMGVSSSGNVYVNGNFSTNGAGSPVPLLNFGLADPKTGSFLSASSVSALATTQAAGSVILVCYNSSGVVQASSQHLISIAFNGAPLVVDKNDNIYQFFYYTNQTFPLQNLGQTSSGITVPLPGVGANYCVAKFNSSGNVVGFSPINNTNTNLPLSMAVDLTGVYLNCRFINATGGLANVNAISTTVSRFANLPTITGQGAAMIKWAL